MLDAFPQKSRQSMPESNSKRLQTIESQAVDSKELLLFQDSNKNE
jgi:hypothetical protein